MKRTKPPSLPRHINAPHASRYEWLWGVALVVLVFAAYWPVLSAGFIWDDDAYVENNPTLRTARGLFDMWFKLGAVPQYYPLVHSTYWIEHQLWGLDPRGYHAVNLLLHALSAWLLWRVLKELAMPGAWLAAALFAVHPVEVESVAWVTERKNVLSCALALGSIWAYLCYQPPADVANAGSDPSTQSPPARRLYALALALYVLALWSKTVTASVPAVLLVIYWWKRGYITRRDVLRLAPFFAVGVVLAGITVWMEKHHVGAQGAEWSLTPLERGLVAGRVLWFYAGKLCWPYPLIFFYARWTIDAGQWWQYLFPLAAIGVIVALWLTRQRIGRGPLAAVLIFAGVLTPALGFFDVYPFRYSFVADHFQYHASIALLALAASVLVAIGRAARGESSWTGPLVAGCLLAVLAGATWQRSWVFHDLAALYEDTISANPLAWAAHQNLGFHLELNGQRGEAIEHYRRAIEIHPTLPRLHNSLGSALFAAGQIDAADAELRQALALGPDSFDEADARAHLGNVLAAQGQFDAAIEQYRAALALRPTHSDALYNLGIALAKLGDYPASIENLRASLAINPNYAAAQHALGVVLLSANQASESIRPLEQAVSLAPDNGRFYETLAAARSRTGDARGAEIAARRAVLIDPQSAEAHNALGSALGQRGDLPGAIAEFELALRCDANHAAASANLRQAREAVSGKKSP